MTRLRTLWRDRRATALIEFAIVLPVLLILFAGGYQLSDAITCKRKVTIMNRAIGDLTSQYRTLRATELDGLMTAATQIMAPYSTDPIIVRVTQITVDDKAETYRIDWSRAHNTYATPPSKYPIEYLPPAYRRPNMVFIKTQTYYRYDTILPDYLDSMIFSDVIWLLPRRSATITLT